MKSILIIDDDPLIRKTLSSHLSKGFEVTSAEDGEEGLQNYEEGMPDLVILDIRLPDLIGQEENEFVLEEMKKVVEKLGH